MERERKKQSESEEGTDGEIERLRKTAKMIPVLST